MNEDMEMELAIEPEEISEAEFNEILGLEGMEDVGETDSEDEENDVEEDASEEEEKEKKKRKRRKKATVDEEDEEELPLVSDGRADYRSAEMPVGRGDDPSSLTSGRVSAPVVAEQSSTGRLATSG